jgi:hypothetical protein
MNLNCKLSPAEQVNDILPSRVIAVEENPISSLSQAWGRGLIDGA